jgi:hypothetical protein
MEAKMNQLYYPSKPRNRREYFNQDYARNQVHATNIDRDIDMQLHIVASAGRVASAHWRSGKTKATLRITLALTTKRLFGQK